jgi:hypothetical protein
MALYSIRQSASHDKFPYYSFYVQPIAYHCVRELSLLEVNTRRASPLRALSIFPKLPQYPEDLRERNPRHLFPLFFTTGLCDNRRYIYMETAGEFRPKKPAQLLVPT